MTHATFPHSAHWGTFVAEVADGKVVATHPFPDDPDPSPILNNIPNSIRHPTRIAQPMIRAGWLDNGPGRAERRGAEPFVPVSWDTATSLLSGELRRVLDAHGPQAIYGGSYGWASAGRFHHAQSQLHRFLNGLGGYTSKRNSYSLGAAEVILPHVFGDDWEAITRSTSWAEVAEQTELLVCFGGLPLKNLAVNPGGLSHHQTRDHLRRTAARGATFELFSPLRDDLPEFVEASWHALRPGSDVAVMLALAHVLIAERLHDTAFLASHCVGFEAFERYVLGGEDGQAKTPEWAEQLSGISAAAMRDLARRMASRRTLITMNFSLQRAEFGEQAPWMGATLSAMLGQIGLSGGGFAFGYGSIGGFGTPEHALGFPALPQGTNGVKAFIPVARVADMLLHPGEPFDYDGLRLTYPHIRLVYWCGGNPFHHHQHISRLRAAFACPETIVVHDPFWTATARHADIVLPSTVTLERDDIAGTAVDSVLVAMHQAIAAFEQARDDYDIFAGLAAALGFGNAFTEGRTAMDWLRHLYSQWRLSVARADFMPPPFEAFWEAGFLELPANTQPDPVVRRFQSFIADPQATPLSTPSGRIELFSETIAGFGYDDCPGHATWLEPTEWLGGPRAQQFPLQLIANNPKTRLHSQLDVGATSQESKICGREPIRLNPTDAAAREIHTGDVVRVFNDRGSCLAGAVITDDVRLGVAQLSTGAWYDPFDPGDRDSMCVHGNPNTLTMDKGTSRLAQGCTGQHVLVEIERWSELLPPVQAHLPPASGRRATISTI
jgi:biotin/methionine sulfoxide reductase